MLCAEAEVICFLSQLYLFLFTLLIFLLLFPQKSVGVEEKMRSSECFQHWSAKGRASGNGKRPNICIAPLRENLTLEALRYGPQLLPCKVTIPAFHPAIKTTLHQLPNTIHVIPSSPLPLVSNTGKKYCNKNSNSW